MTERQVAQSMHDKGYIYMIFPMDLSLDPLFAKRAEEIGPLLREYLPGDATPDIRMIDLYLENTKESGQ